LCLDVKTVCIDKWSRMWHCLSMPKLWHDTIEAHRSAVADAIMDHTAALAAAEGLHGVTMARVAKETGIGRATLYKYFREVPEILAAWHRRQIAAHLEDLQALRDKHESPIAALEAVLISYAQHRSHPLHHGSLSQILHGQPHMNEAHQHLHAFVADLIGKARKAGELDSSASVDESARYVLAAMQAAHGAHSRPAVARLVRMVLKGVGGNPSKTGGPT
jgi:AcrR family transcriptional regulator